MSKTSTAKKATTTVDRSLLNADIFQDIPPVCSTLAATYAQLKKSIADNKPITELYSQFVAYQTIRVLALAVYEDSNSSQTLDHPLNALIGSLDGLAHISFTQAKLKGLQPYFNDAMDQKVQACLTAWNTYQKALAEVITLTRLANQEKRITLDILCTRTEAEIDASTAFIEALRAL